MLQVVYATMYPSERLSMQLFNTANVQVLQQRWHVMHSCDICSNVVICGDVVKHTNHSKLAWKALAQRHVTSGSQASARAASPRPLRRWYVISNYVTKMAFQPFCSLLFPPGGLDADLPHHFFTSCSPVASPAATPMASHPFQDAAGMLASDD